jgi:hypothetical protein
VEHDEALQLAVAFLARSQGNDEPPLAIDTERVRKSNGLLIVPCNCVQYLASREVRQQLLAIKKRLTGSVDAGAPFLGQYKCWNGWVAAVDLLPVMDDRADPDWVRDCRKLGATSPL